MGNALPKMNLDAFLSWENEQPERHEFVRGEVFAMVGGRRINGRVSFNLAIALANQLKGSPCQVFGESMKVATSDDTVFYPDVFVTCDPRDLRTEQVFTAPTVIVEVLSPTTQAYDRGLKFTLYRNLASLREYTLIDPETREVQMFRRGADGLFTLHDLTGIPAIEFVSIGCTVTAEDLFDGVVVQQPPDPAD